MGKMFQTTYLLKGQYQKFIKNTYNSTAKEKKNQFKNGQRAWIDITLKKIYERPTGTWNGRK